MIKVDNTTTLPVGTTRNSVRISTRATYTTALMIFDVLHMPWGCSVRPAPPCARYGIFSYRLLDQVWPAIWTVR